MREQGQELSDADLWESLVKSGKSPAMATALVEQRRKSFVGKGTSRSWEEAQPEKVNPLVGMARSANQGLTFGFGDELSAAMGAGMDKLNGQPFGESYSARVQAERDADRQFKADHPVLGYGSEIAGGMMTGKAIPQLAKIGAVKAGALAGAAYGAGVSEGGLPERATGAGVGAVVGSIPGGAAAGWRALRKGGTSAAGAAIGGVKTMRDVLLASQGEPGAVGRLATRFAASQVPKKATAKIAEEVTEDAVPKVSGLIERQIDNLGQLGSRRDLPVQAHAPAPRIPIRIPTDGPAPVVDEAPKMTEGFVGNGIENFRDALSSSGTAVGRRAGSRIPIRGPQVVGEIVPEVAPSPAPQVGDVVDLSNEPWKGHPAKGATKARFKDWEDRLAARKAADQSVVDAANPVTAQSVDLNALRIEDMPPEAMMELSNEFIRKGGTLQQLNEILSRFRRP